MKLFTTLFLVGLQLLSVRGFAAEGVRFLTENKSQAETDADTARWRAANKERDLQIAAKRAESERWNLLLADFRNRGGNVSEFQHALNAGISFEGMRIMVNRWRPGLKFGVAGLAAAITAGAVIAPDSASAANSQAAPMAISADTTPKSVDTSKVGVATTFDSFKKTDSAK